MKKRRKKEEKGKERDRPAEGTRRGDKNIYAMAKNSHCTRAKASRMPAIQNFRRTCSLRMTTPCVVHTTDAGNNMARRVCACSRF